MQYFNEISRIGFKFNLNPNLNKLIYSFNEKDYPTHFNTTIKSEYNYVIPNMKFCTITKNKNCTKIVF